jgi:multidrug resistance efflux pump
MHLHPRYRLFLDALIAAVILTVMGLTLFVFFQAPSRTHFRAHLNPMIRLPHIFQIPVIAEVDGRVTSTCLREGMHVHRGDILVQLDTRDLLIQKRTLERLIHFAEDHHRSASSLYRELEQTRLDIGRHTITSAVEGRITATATLRPGDVIQRGNAIAIQVIESRHAGYSVWPSMHR